MGRDLSRLGEQFDEAVARLDGLLKEQTPDGKARTYKLIHDISNATTGFLDAAMMGRSFCEKPFPQDVLDLQARAHRRLLELDFQLHGIDGVNRALERWQELHEANSDEAFRVLEYAKQYLGYARTQGAPGQECDALELRIQSLSV